MPHAWNRSLDVLERVIRAGCPTIRASSEDCRSLSKCMLVCQPTALALLVDADADGRAPAVHGRMQARRPSAELRALMSPGCYGAQNCVTGWNRPRHTTEPEWFKRGRSSP